MSKESLRVIRLVRFRDDPDHFAPTAFKSTGTPRRAERWKMQVLAKRQMALPTTNHLQLKVC